MDKVCDGEGKWSDGVGKVFAGEIEWGDGVGKVCYVEGKWSDDVSCATMKMNGVMMWVKCVILMFR